MPSYIFDVDGTLTPSRAILDSAFGNWMEMHLTHKACYIVTGSDRKKTLEQIPNPLYNLFIRSYQCSGNDVWEGSKHVGSADVDFPDQLYWDLEILLRQSTFPIKRGNHVDVRPGLVNFSIVGPGASSEERELYKQWDSDTDERQTIASRLSKQYPSLHFAVAGETGIDITDRGNDKSQILVDFPSEDEHIYFFGDKCQPGGNDHEIATAVGERINGTVFEVNDWNDTWNILKRLWE